jgi:hypothetical protein
MAKNSSSYLTTTVPFKPSPVRPVTAIKPIKPLVWKAPPLPKADPTALARLVKDGPAGIKARTAAKR